MFSKRKIRLGRTLLVNREREKTLFFVNHPFWGSIIASFLFYMICIAISIMTGTVAALQRGVTPELGVGINAVFNSLSFVILYEGFLILSKDMYFGKSKLGAVAMSLPFIVFLVFSRITLGLPGYYIITDKMVGMALVSASIEEVAFRFIPITCFKRPCVKKISDVKIALFTAGLFALYHIPNIFTSGNYIKGAISIVIAFLVGIFFAAIYIKTGSILVCMILHFFNNVIASASEYAWFYGAMISLLFAIVCAVFAIAVLRKEGLFDRFKKFLEKNRMYTRLEKRRKDVYRGKRK